MKTRILFLIHLLASAALPGKALASYSCASDGKDPFELRVLEDRLELSGGGTYTATGRGEAGFSEFSGEAGLLRATDSLLDGEPAGRVEWQGSNYECGLLGDDFSALSALTAATRCSRRVMTIHGPVTVVIPCPKLRADRRPPPRPRPECRRTLRGCGPS